MEVEFRAYRFQNEFNCYQKGLDDPFAYSSEITGRESDCLSTFFNTCDQEQLDYEQYSGFKDINLKKIFAGDIVRHNGIRINENLEVKFIDGAFCLGNIGSEKPSYGDWVTIRDAQKQAIKYGTKLELEIIGNIHENSELSNTGGRSGRS